MDIENRFPVFRIHFDKAFVPENAGVVDQNIHGAERIQCRFNDIFTAFRSGNTVIVGHGLTAGRLDLIDHFVRRSLVAAGSVPASAEIIDHDVGAPFGQIKSVNPAQAAPGPGYDRHFAVKTDVILGNLTVFTKAVGDDILIGFGVGDLPDRLAGSGIPDFDFNGIAGIKGFGKTAFQSPEFFGFARHQVLDQRPAGIPVSTKAMHDRPFKTGHFGELRVGMERKQVSGQAVDQRLVRGRMGIDLEIRVFFGKGEGFRGRVFPSEAAVKPGKNRQNAGEQFFTVGMPGFAFTDDQGALSFALVIHVSDFSFGGERAFHRNRVVEDQVLLAVHDAGEIDVGIYTDMGEKIKNRGNGKGGNDFEIFLIGVFGFRKSGSHAKGIQHHVLPRIVFGDGTDFFPDGIKVQRHFESSFTGLDMLIVPVITKV